MTDEDRRIVRLALEKYFDAVTYSDDVYAPDEPPERVESGAWVKLEVFVPTSDIEREKR